MDFRPLWRGPVGLSAVALIALPVTDHLDRAEPMRHRAVPVHVMAPPTPGADAAPAVAPSPPEPVLVGIFTAEVATWDASAAAARLTHRQASRRLRNAGVKRWSSGRCTDARRPSCTSLQSIRYGTLMQLIDLKRDSGCDITVTGGTETGHARGRYSHGTGFKVDIAHNPCIDAYIRRRFRRVATRRDGVPIYRPPANQSPRSGPDDYADEATHWDILFR